MTQDVWDARADLYRKSDAHREGPDLDLLVRWATDAGARTALDVATGGGHVARRLREAGLEVVTTDRAPGMRPDVIAPAEHLPFADASFDVVATRVAAHHFDDVEAATREMARVAGDRVLVVDNLHMGKRAEMAERLRDPTHVRNYDEVEWRRLLEDGGLHVDEVERFDKAIELEPWFERAGTPETDAVRVRELLADRIEDGWVRLERIALKALKR
jgi:SAM-dependent methyltransferase